MTSLDVQDALRTAQNWTAEAKHRADHVADHEQLDRERAAALGDAANIGCAVLSVSGIAPVATDENLQATSVPLRSPAAVVAHYAQRAGDGVGVVTGQHPGGIAVIAVRTTSDAWRRFYREQGHVTRTRDMDGGTATEVDALGFGRPVSAVWTRPAPQVATRVVVGSREFAETSRRPPAPVAEGYLLWVVPPSADGRRLVVARRPKLAAGVDLVPDGSVVPLFARRSDGGPAGGGRPAANAAAHLAGRRTRRSLAGRTVNNYEPPPGPVFHISFPRPGRATAGARRKAHAGGTQPTRPHPARRSKAIREGPILSGSGDRACAAHPPTYRDTARRLAHRLD